MSDENQYTPGLVVSGLAKPLALYVVTRGWLAQGFSKADTAIIDGVLWRREGWALCEACGARLSAENVCGEACDVLSV